MVVVVLAGLAYFRGKRQDPMDTVKTDQYQAVLLANGQAYFGKIKAFNSEYVKIESIYYFQNNQINQTNQDQNNQQLTLTKLGNEIHGPEDVMFIERQQLVFWENLKDDSKVVQTIKSRSN